MICAPGAARASRFLASPQVLALCSPVGTMCQSIHSSYCLLARPWSSQRGVRESEAPHLPQLPSVQCLIYDCGRGWWCPRHPYILSLLACRLLVPLTAFPVFAECWEAWCSRVQPLKTWVQIPAQPLPSCVTWDKLNSLHFCSPIRAGK